MAGSVSVESAAIQGGINCCNTSINELDSASRALQRSYQAAGSGGWKDQKYTQLGSIVSDCCNALTKPISELQECMRKLDELLKAVSDYENVNL